MAPKMKEKLYKFRLNYSVDFIHLFEAQLSSNYDRHNFHKHHKIGHIVNGFVFVFPFNQKYSFVNVIG